MKKSDVVIILSVSIIAFISMIMMEVAGGNKGNNVAYAEIFVDGELYKSIDLQVDQQFEIKTSWGLNEVHVHDGGIEMIEANCPDKVCIDMGYKTKKNEIIVCIPNKVYIKLKDDKEEELDAISN